MTSLYNWLTLKPLPEEGIELPRRSVYHTLRECLSKNDTPIRLRFVIMKKSVVVVTNNLRKVYQSYREIQLESPVLKDGDGDDFRLRYRISPGEVSVLRIEKVFEDPKREVRDILNCSALVLCGFE